MEVRRRRGQTRLAKRAAARRAAEAATAAAAQASYDAAEANKARISEQIRQQAVNRYRQERAASNRDRLAAERQAHKEAEALAKKKTKGSDKYSLHSPTRDRKEEEKTHALTTIGQQLKGPAMAGGPVGFLAGAGQYLQYEAAGITNLAALGKHVAVPAATVPGHAIDTGIGAAVGAFSGDAVGPAVEGGTRTAALLVKQPIETTWGQIAGAALTLIPAAGYKGAKTAITVAQAASQNAAARRIAMATAEQGITDVLEKAGHGKYIISQGHGEQAC